MTYIHKFKCGYCSLRYTVYSFHEEFPYPFCPECGRKASVLHWIEKSDKQIFEFVPGHTPFALDMGVKNAEA